MRPAVTLIVAGVLVAACAPAHIAPYTPKKRVYEPGTSASRATEKDSQGSLWREGTGAAMLFTDQRALREQDIVVVHVEEIANAQRRADTGIRRDSSLNADVSAQVSAFLAAAGTTQPAVDVGMSTSFGNRFDAQGSTARTERLVATVPALVRKVLDNGNLFIEGHRVVLVNQEEQHFYISGVVRPIDIDQQNSVKSSKIADAEIEFTGHGVLTDNQRQGWLSRYFGWMWPF